MQRWVVGSLKALPQGPFRGTRVALRGVGCVPTALRAACWMRQRVLGAGGALGTGLRAWLSMHAGVSGCYLRIR